MWRLHGMAVGAVLQPDHYESAVQSRAGYPAYPAGFFPVASGGVLVVAVCLNGPRQQEKLLPFSDVREELPRGTFAYTDVPTMIIRLRA